MKGCLAGPYCKGCIRCDPAPTTCKIVWCPLHSEWVVSVGYRRVGAYASLLEAETAAIAESKRLEGAPS